jgi:hypothetical protein
MVSATHDPSQERLRILPLVLTLSSSEFLGLLSFCPETNSCWVFGGWGWGVRLGFEHHTCKSGILIAETTPPASFAPVSLEMGPLDLFTWADLKPQSS